MYWDLVGTRFPPCVSPVSDSARLDTRDTCIDTCTCVDMYYNVSYKNLHVSLCRGSLGARYPPSVWPYLCSGARRVPIMAAATTLDELNKYYYKVSIVSLLCIVTYCV